MAEQPVQGGKCPATSSHLRGDHQRLLDDRGKQQRAKADSLLGHMAALLMQRGDSVHVNILLLTRNAVIEHDGGSQTDDLWLEIDPGDYATFIAEVQERLNSVFEQVSQRLNYGVTWLGFRETLPLIGPDWRERLHEMMSVDRPTNQARRTMPAHPQWVMDRLAFTNAGERSVYEALKHMQEKELPAEETISIFPLPNGRVLGHT